MANTWKETKVSGDLITSQDYNDLRDYLINNAPKEISFCIHGDAYVTTKIAQILVGANLAKQKISKIKTYSDIAPTGASLIVDVNKNGTTIFTTQNKRPEIAAGANADDSDTPDVTALSEGDRLNIDIDQIGSTIAGGNDLLITFVMEN